MGALTVPVLRPDILIWFLHPHKLWVSVPILTTTRRSNVLTLDRGTGERMSFVLFIMGCLQFSIKRLMVSRHLPCRMSSQAKDCMTALCHIMSSVSFSVIPCHVVSFLSNDVSVTTLLCIESSANQPSVCVIKQAILREWDNLFVWV